MNDKEAFEKWYASQDKAGVFGNDDTSYVELAWQAACAYKKEEYSNIMDAMTKTSQNNAELQGQLKSCIFVYEEKVNRLKVESQVLRVNNVLLENKVRQYQSTILELQERTLAIGKLEAENEKLKKALRFTVLAAEQQYQPSRPLQEGLCLTFYFTLSYEGDLELIEETKRARQVLDEVDNE